MITHQMINGAVRDIFALARLHELRRIAHHAELMVRLVEAEQIERQRRPCVETRSVVVEPGDRIGASARPVAIRDLLAARRRSRARGP